LEVGEMSRHVWPFAVVLVAGVGWQAHAAEPPPPRPTAGCVTFTDAAGDSSQAGATPDDADLDIVDVTLASPPDLLRAYVHVTKLGAPALGLGHQFSFGFKLDNKPVSIFGGRDEDGNVDAAHQTAAGTNFVSSLSGVRYGGALIAGAAPTLVYDTTHNTVVITLARKVLETASKSTLPDGTILSALSVQTAGDYFTTVATADTAEPAAPATTNYVLGDNHCFEPPHGHLTVPWPTTSVAGHTISLRGTLTDDQAVGVGGKSLTVSGDGSPVVTTTAADGSFGVTLPAPTVAGSLPIVVTWGGDDSLQKTAATSAITVTKQPTALTLSRARSGSRSTVTARLVNDAASPIAGGLVTWYVDGKAVGSGRTNTVGKVSRVAAIGHSVKAVFAATPRYLGSQRQVTS
jgi:hypothetical protein